jgi:nicotinic acid mononucleotide adenylyltransferase
MVGPPYLAERSRDLERSMRSSNPPLQGDASSLVIPETGCPCADTIAERVSRELASMRDLLGSQAGPGAIDALDRWTRATLERIEALFLGNVIGLSPHARNRVRSGRPSFAVRPQRLGVFPVAANPLHWLHILAGLATMETCRLDKVVYVVAGVDKRKPFLAPEEYRHDIAKEVLRLFSPLLEYSPIARGGDADGEENVFRVIASQHAGPLHAFYIAGSDHYRRFSNTHKGPDTLQKLEKGVRRHANGFNPRRHRLSVVFIDRGTPLRNVRTFLDVRWVNAPPFRTSSTKIRGALAGDEPINELSFLPFSAYRAICSHGLYLARCPGTMIDDSRDRQRERDQAAARRMR